MILVLVPGVARGIVLGRVLEAAREVLAVAVVAHAPIAVLMVAQMVVLVVVLDSALGVAVAHANRAVTIIVRLIVNEYVLLVTEDVRMLWLALFQVNKIMFNLI